MEIQTPEMETFLGVKLIKASKAMTRREYCGYRGWELPADENGDDLVYLVEYEVDEGSKPNHPNHEGYISMSPVHVFDKAYRKTDGLTFGLAIEALRKGLCVARKGWNGNGMFICKQVPAEIYCNIIPKMSSLPDAAKDILYARDKSIHYVNQMIIVKPDNTIDSWVASSSDTFAEDWYIVNV